MGVMEEYTKKHIDEIRSVFGSGTVTNDTLLNIYYSKKRKKAEKLQSQIYNAASSIYESMKDGETISPEKSEKLIELTGLVEQFYEGSSIQKEKKELDKKREKKIDKALKNLTKTINHYKNNVFDFGVFGHGDTVKFEPYEKQFTQEEKEAIKKINESMVTGKESKSGYEHYEILSNSFDTIMNSEFSRSLSQNNHLKFSGFHAKRTLINSAIVAGAFALGGSTTLGSAPMQNASFQAIAQFALGTFALSAVAVTLPTALGSFGSSAITRLQANKPLKYLSSCNLERRKKLFKAIENLDQEKITPTLSELDKDNYEAIKKEQTNTKNVYQNMLEKYDQTAEAYSNSKGKLNRIAYKNAKKSLKSATKDLKKSTQSLKKADKKIESSKRANYKKKLNEIYNFTGLKPRHIKLLKQAYAYAGPEGSEVKITAWLTKNTRKNKVERNNLSLPNRVIESTDTPQQDFLSRNLGNNPVAAKLGMIPVAANLKADNGKLKYARARRITKEKTNKINTNKSEYNKNSKQAGTQLRKIGRFSQTKQNTRQ